MRAQPVLTLQHIQWPPHSLEVPRWQGVHHAALGNFPLDKDVEEVVHRIAWEECFLIKQTLGLVLSLRKPTKDLSSIVEEQVELDLSCICVAPEYLPLQSRP